MGLSESREEDVPEAEAAHVETKYHRKTGCTISWGDSGVEIAVTKTGEKLSIPWHCVYRICTQPMFSKSSLLVFDCIPEGQKVPMLVKIWLHKLAPLDSFKSRLVAYNKSVDAENKAAAAEAGSPPASPTGGSAAAEPATPATPATPGASDKPFRRRKIATGKSILWSNLFSTTMLPYYHRWMNDAYRSCCALLDFLVVVVTVFAVLDLLNLGVPGVSDASFFEKAADAFKVGESNYDLMQSSIAKHVALLSREDRAIVNERWAQFGWSHTFVDNRVIFQQDEALEALRQQDYLDIPRRAVADWAWFLSQVDYVELIKANPVTACVLFPAVSGLSVFLGVILSSVVAIATTIFVLQRIIGTVLSLKATVLIRNLVYDVRTIVSQARSMSQRTIGMLRFAYSQATKLWVTLTRHQQKREKKNKVE